MYTYYFIIRDEHDNSTLVSMESEKREDAFHFLSEFYKTHKIEFLSQKP
ncbi:hypothetical protein [Tepidibacillus marianensis]